LFHLFYSINFLYRNFQCCNSTLSFI
jgi:hypothetical protein